MPERVSRSPQERTKNRYLNNEGRPDILICNTGNLSDQEMDISLAHPWSKEVIKNCAKVSAFAAKKREEMKNAKYDSEIFPGSNASKCIPEVFEHFGTWGVAADRLLNTLSLKSKDEEGQNNSADFKTYWRRRFPLHCRNSMLVCMIMKN